MNTLKYNDIEIRPIENQPFSYAYMDGKPLGRVEIDGTTGLCSFDIFAYEADGGRFTDAAHFIWTLYNSIDWTGIYDVNLDPVSKGRQLVWRAENTTSKNS